jgi:peptidoglycan/LPS O-acetylase OafA/YrhL
LTAGSGMSVPVVRAVTSVEAPAVVGREAASATTGRLRQLDLLRGVAVILVILHHWGMEFPTLLPARVTARSGWVGVDLFFVLSGFLVSGLLFREYQRHGEVKLLHFLVRRGLKIYPAFYVFLGLTLLLGLVVHVAGFPSRPAASSIWAESLFVQNYFPGVWSHTWSLAVEEHFYLGLGILVAWGSRKGLLAPTSRVMGAGLTLCAVVLLARTIHGLGQPYNWFTMYAPTHLRVDGLAFGVLLSYLFHFERERLESFVLRQRWPLLACSLALASTGLVFRRGTAVMETIGLTALWLGFGGLMMLLLIAGKGSALLEGRASRAVCRCAEYSYSVYLWHIPTILLVGALLRSGGRELNPYLTAIVYVFLSFAVGIAMAKLVELPVLHLRDRLYPSRSGALSTRDR